MALDPADEVGILIDTNLLLLLLVGDYSALYLKRWSRTEQFGTADYKALRDFIAGRRLITTPNVLTEVSNFLGHLPEPARSATFEAFVTLVEALEEGYTASRVLATRDHLADFGLTDLGVIEVCRDKHAVLTVDGPLSAYLYKMGIEVIDFRSIKSRSS